MNANIAMYTSLVISILVFACGKQENDERKEGEPPRKTEDATGFNVAASEFCGDAPAVKPDTSMVPTVNGIDMTTFTTQLQAGGVTGWIHGAVHQFGHYVFTYREGFFNSIETTLIPSSQDIATVMATLKRHDKVTIRGRFLENSAPIKHILVSGIDIVEVFATSDKGETYQHKANLKDIVDAKVYPLIVHSVVASGAALAIEYEDAVIPLLIPTELQDLSKGLYRNDIVLAKIKKMGNPESPTHLTLVDSQKASLTVVDRMKNCHGKSQTLSGTVVFFPRSPQISRDVYALHAIDANGLSRHWTLVNFENQYLFNEIQNKVAAGYNSKRSSIERARNYFVNNKVRIDATGIMNVVSPSQANPQLIIDDLKKLNVR